MSTAKEEIVKIKEAIKVSLECGQMEIAKHQSKLLEQLLESELDGKQIHVDGVTYMRRRGLWLDHDGDLIGDDLARILNQVANS